MRLVLASLLLAAGVLACGAATAQDMLPPGPGHDTTVKACGGCHDIGTFSGVRRSQDAWETTITNMINFGAMISDDDFDTVLTYLTAYLGLKPPPPAPPPTASP
jgi:hypothetical protein